MLSHSESDDAFLAGILEADGCFSLSVNTYGRPAAKIQLANTSIILHKWTTDRYKGNTSWAENKFGRWGRTDWTSKASMKFVLETVLPYLVSKKEEVQLMLEYVNWPDGRTIKFPTERFLELVGRIKYLHNGGRT
jgi:hypothetical protein